MAQTFSLINIKSIAERKKELNQAYSAWEDTIAEKYLQIFLLQIGVPKFETRGWLSKTDKYYKEISDLLLEKEDWYEIIKLVIGMEYWPIDHKFPASGGHMFRTGCNFWSDWDGGRTQRLRVWPISNLRGPKVKKGDYYVLHEDKYSRGLWYNISLFSGDGRWKRTFIQDGRVRLCFNNEHEGVYYHHEARSGYDALFLAEWTKNISKYVYEGRRPDP